MARRCSGITEHILQTAYIAELELLRGQQMLVLPRRAGESIMIDNEIELKVLKIRGSQVHLGIDAPKRAAVHPANPRLLDTQNKPNPHILRRL